MTGKNVTERKPVLSTAYIGNSWIGIGNFFRKSPV
jgi:hypothetical protein